MPASPAPQAIGRAPRENSGREKRQHQGESKPTAYDGRRRSTCSAATNDANAAVLKATPGMSHPIEKLLIEAKTSRITPIPATKPSEARKSGADLTAR